VKQFSEMQKMMKRMGAMGGAKPGKSGKKGKGPKAGKISPRDLARGMGDIFGGPPGSVPGLDGSAGFPPFPR